MATALTKMGNSPRTNYEGIKVGKLDVIMKVPAPNHVSRKNLTYYKCRCECGKELVVSSNNITKYVTDEKLGRCKRQHSCGCYLIKLKAGMVVGKLTLIEPVRIHTTNLPNKKSGNRKARHITYFKCKCECGNEKLINNALILKNIHHKRKDQVPLSCGCARSDAARLNMLAMIHRFNKEFDPNDIVGTQIGKITVNKIHKEFKNNQVVTLYECQCNNGHVMRKTRGYLQQILRDEKTFVCKGCIREGGRIPIGTVVGNLTVKEAIPKNNIKCLSNSYNYKCSCVCGKEVIFSKMKLYPKNEPKYAISCGCEKKRQMILNTKTYNGVPVKYLDRIKKGAKKRELKYTLTDDYVTDLYHKQNKLCALTGKPIWFFCDKDNPNEKTNASLDRINNNKGYIKGNVQWVDTKINMLKLSWGNEEFKKMCKAVANFNLNEKTEKSVKIPTKPSDCSNMFFEF